MKSAFLACGVLVFSFSAWAQEFQILEDWAVEIAEPQRALEYPYQFFLGGLSQEEDAFFVASANGELTKRSLRTGQSLWRARLAGESQSRWTYSNGRVFGGDSEGFLYAINATNGDIIWQVRNRGVFFSAPLVRGDTLWAVNSFGDLETYRTEDGTWIRQHRDPQPVNLGLWAEQGPIFFGEELVVGFPSGMLQAIDPIRGERLWSSTFGSVVSEAIGLNDLKSYSSGGDFLVASSFNGNTRAWQKVGASKRQIWEKRLSIPQPVTFSEDGRYFFASDREGRLSRYDSESGFVEWQQQLDGGVGTQPALSRSLVWVGSSEGRIFVLDREGRLLSQSRDFQTEFYSQPLVIDDREALILSSRGILRRVQLKQIEALERPSLSRWREVFRFASAPQADQD